MSVGCALSSLGEAHGSQDLMSEPKPMPNCRLQIQGLKRKAEEEAQGERQENEPSVFDFKTYFFLLNCANLLLK